MAKPNLALLGKRTTRPVVPVTYPYEGEELTVYLREPMLAEVMTASETFVEQQAQWVGPGKDWYPNDPPFPVSKSVLGCVVMVQQQQCNEHGGPLSEEEAYTFHELIILLSLHDPAFWKFHPVTEDFYRKQELEEVSRDAGNASEAGAEPS